MLFDFLRRLFSPREVRCCCPAPACCPCEDLPSSASMTDGMGNTLNFTKVGCETAPNGQYTATPGNFCGASLVNAIISCNDGVWQITGFFGTATLAASGNCAGLLLTGTWGSCSVTVTI